jgi:CRISPR-associated endonuclease/helicase Cas3
VFPHTRGWTGTVQSVRATVRVFPAVAGTFLLTDFWGKAREGGGAAHPLLAHCLDVAAVAVLSAPAGLGIDPRAVGFLVALHDVGKFSRPFQAKAREFWPDALGSYVPAPPGPAHDVVGAHLLSRPLAADLDDLMPPTGGNTRGWTPSTRMHVWRALEGHHGRPPAPGDVSDKVVCNACVDSARTFLADLRSVFNPPVWRRPVSERDVILLSWRLAGLTTLADWVGSNVEWFPYVESIGDPSAYFWGRALPQAAAALAAAGLSATRASAFTGLRGLFPGPGITDLTPVQKWAETVELPDGPVLAVIEDQTGSGKTEAAMCLTHRLMASGRSNGVYVALPTMATANAMYGRAADCYSRLFAPDTRPSLALAHGHADLDIRFRAAIDGGTANPADAEAAESRCAAWLASSNRRALLAQVGVGTVDQALLAVLPVRHATLRLQGLSGKVLLIDECHAYDAYMREELCALLRFHAALGGSVILLSATLPRSMRQSLVDAYRDGLSAQPVEPTSQEYPLATIAGRDVVQETPCAPEVRLSRRVRVTRLNDADAAVDRIVPSADAGAAVCWVRNTVNDAIEAAELLRARGVEATLFHARFAMSDRLQVEAEVLRRWGRRGTDRPGVLVATQVVEQSLDIDFDLMVSDLAPVDLLIQRAGRLWRHERGDRREPGPELLIVSPPPVADPGPAWILETLPGSALVYGDALLWRSARVLFAAGEIVSPSGLRGLIEGVYAPADAVPPGLTRAAGDAERRELRAAAVGRQAVLNLRAGYRADVGQWDSDVRTPTRLEERPTVRLRLAFERDGVLVPYASDTYQRRAWALSEVAVAQYRIAACPVPPGLTAAAERARGQWGRWEREAVDRVVLAILTPDGDGYRLAAQSEKGQAVAARYDATSGLSW